MRYLKTMALMVLLATVTACGGGSGGPSPSSGGGANPTPPPAPAPKTAEDYLKDKKFTTGQPKVLEQVGVHHAYTKGLTERGFAWV